MNAWVIENNNQGNEPFLNMGVEKNVYFRIKVDIALLGAINILTSRNFTIICSSLNASLPWATPF